MKPLKCGRNYSKYKLNRDRNYLVSEIVCRETLKYPRIDVWVHDSIYIPGVPKKMYTF